VGESFATGNHEVRLRTNLPKNVLVEDSITSKPHTCSLYLKQNLLSFLADRSKTELVVRVPYFGVALQCLPGTELVLNLSSGLTSVAREGRKIHLVKARTNCIAINNRESQWLRQRHHGREVEGPMPPT
jgi:hypothetical protein